jgi:hypothetical protein
MIDDIDKYIDLLCELQINEHQFLILWLVKTKDEKNIAKYKARKGDFNIHDIMYLIDMNYLNDFGIIKDGERHFNIYDFLVTDKFEKAVVVDKDEAFEELVGVYPSWFNIQGKRVPAKSFDDKLADEYHKYHKNNRLKHEKVIAITRDYHEKFTGGFAQVKLENYIRGRMWLIYKEMLDGGPADIGFKVY